MKKNGIKETLKAALKLIARPERWSKGFYKSGLGEDARFCAVGALYEVDGPHQGRARGLLRKTCYDLHGTYVESFNDKRSTRHADIVALYKAAIRRAKLPRQV